MKTCPKKWVAIILFVFFYIALFFANTIPALAAEYRYIEKRKPFRFVNGSVGINNNGVVFGSHDFGLIKLSIPSLPSTGFIYNGLTYTELLPIGDRGAAITDMNDSGAAVGYSFDFNWMSQGFLYKHGIYTKVTPPGCLRSITTDINNSEAVIVNAYDSSGKIKGFLYSDSIYTELLPTGCTISDAVKSNDNGTIIVNGSDGIVEDNGTEKYFAFLFKDGVYTKLLPVGWTSSEAQDINENGQVLCSGTDPTGREMVFIYQVGKPPQVLEKCENPGGFVFMDINDSGVVICNSNLYGPSMYKDGIYTKVLPEGWDGAHLMKINNNGEIIGYGKSAFVYKDGNYIELGKGWYEPMPYDINNKGVIAGTFQDTCCVDSFPSLYLYLCKRNLFIAIPQ